MHSALLKPEMVKNIADLYARMEDAYDLVARQLDFSCQGCSDNCCDSYFLHHTYIEWAYLWEGLRSLSKDFLLVIRERSAQYLAEAEKFLSEGRTPVIMCPMNEAGRCSLYTHRLMICRMHGVPSSLTQPNGRTVSFPGCFRCQEIVGQRQALPAVDRTSLYRELVNLEAKLLGTKKGLMPKARMTIAQMIVQGPPAL
jgi:hypothetical protein